MRKHRAINWNAPTHKFYDDVFLKQVEQFWLPEEIPVSEDKLGWDALDAQTKEAYERILVGLTLLDTEQSNGIQKIGDATNDLFIQSIMALFAGFESIHARSYSTIFQTLCTSERIDELFTWAEETQTLQQKVDKIVTSYDDIEDEESLFISMIGSLCLEGICFYSGFYLPLLLAGQGKMVNSGEIISLILRDELLHTVAVGFFAKQKLATFDETTQARLLTIAREMILAVYELEIAYSSVIYEKLEVLDEVKTYVQYNVNYVAQCLDVEPFFDVKKEDVNAIVMNGYSTETKNHDFFSTKGNGYIKTTKVEQLQDDDFYFND